MPNPSFEDTVSCPLTQDQVSYATGWEAFGQSSDYFNSCSIPGDVGVPYNYYGEQNAATGNAYCGLIAYVKYIEDWREYIGTQLSSELISGTKYYVSFKSSLSDSSNYAVNNLGVLFSTVPFDEFTNPALPNNHAQLQAQQIFSNKINWTVLSGSFIADSAYKYLLIGNFFKDSVCDTLFVGIGTQMSNFDESYYYIDDVCVSPDSLECDLNPEGIHNLLQQQIAIYPNPATEKVEITFSSPTIVRSIEMFDLVGRKLMNDELLVNHSNHYSINTKNFPRGYYFIRINTSEGMINRKIVLK